MSDEHNFQKRLAKLQIQASAVITIGGILIAIGLTILVTQIPRDLYPGMVLPFYGLVYHYYCIIYLV